MFTLESMTKVRVLDARVLARKDRKPDELAGMKLLLRATMSSAALAMFDGFLPGVLYRKATEAPQGALDGIEPVELTTIGNKVKRLPWEYEQTGCTVEIDYGSGGSRNIVLDDCKVYGVQLGPKGSGVDVQWVVDAPALSDETRGKLTGLKSTDIQMTQSGPEVADEPQRELGTDPNATPADKPKRGRPPKAAKAAADDAQNAAGEPERGPNWPFPKDGTPIDAELAQTH